MGARRGSPVGDSRHDTKAARESDLHVAGRRALVVHYEASHDSMVGLGVSTQGCFRGRSQGPRSHNRRDVQSWRRELRPRFFETPPGRGPRGPRSCSFSIENSRRGSTFRRRSTFFKNKEEPQSAPFFCLLTRVSCRVAALTATGHGKSLGFSRQPLPLRRTRGFVALSPHLRRGSVKHACVDRVMIHRNPPRACVSPRPRPIYSRGGPMAV